MLKLIHDTLPQGYAVCLHNDCPLAQTCLHQLAYSPLLETREELRMLNPNRCSKDETCKFYRSNKPLRYARGFASFQPKMLPGQWSAFVSILREKWGRTRFYERRRGDIAMPPAEQEFILKALNRSGVTEIFEFDKYEYLLTWYDYACTPYSVRLYTVACTTVHCSLYDRTLLSVRARLRMN